MCVCMTTKCGGACVGGLVGVGAWLACVLTHEKHLRFLAEAYVSTRQHTSAYVSLGQHTYALLVKHLRLLAEV